MANLNKMKKCELIELFKIKQSYILELEKENNLIQEAKDYCNELKNENEKLIKENEEIKINTMKCCKDLGNKNEKLEKEIEEMTNKYERLLKHKREIDADNTKTTDLFNRASHENQILKRVDKNKALAKVLAENKHLIEYSNNQSKEKEKLRDENKELEKDYEDVKRRNSDKYKQIEKVKKEIEKLRDENYILNQKNNHYSKVNSETDDMFNRSRKENEKQKEEIEKLKEEKSNFYKEFIIKSLNKLKEEIEINNELI